MRVLLTGAGGFTGRHFAAVAAARGWDVIPLSADLTDANAVTAEVAVSAPDAVVHLAAISFVGHHDQRLIYDVNLFGTLNLLTALEKLATVPKHVLIASTANVYGNAAFSPITEAAREAPVNHYAASKLSMEHLSRTYAQRLPITIVRPFNYTGVGHSVNFVIPKMVDHFARRADRIELGNLDVEREFNDVRMVVDAYLRLLQSPRTNETINQTINVCTGQAIALREVLRQLSEMTSHQIEVAVNPAFARKDEVHRLSGDNHKLVSIIGDLKPIPLKDTLRWMLDSAVLA